MVAMLPVRLSPSVPIGVESSDDRSRLFPGPAMRLTDRDLLAVFGLPLACKGRIHIRIQLARRIIGNIHQGHGVGRTGADAGEGEQGQQEQESQDGHRTSIPQCGEKHFAIPALRAEMVTMNIDRLYPQTKSRLDARRLRERSAAPVMKPLRRRRNITALKPAGHRTLQRSA